MFRGRSREQVPRDARELAVRRNPQFRGALRERPGEGFPHGRRDNPPRVVGRLDAEDVDAPRADGSLDSIGRTEVDERRLRARAGDDRGVAVLGEAAFAPGPVPVEVHERLVRLQERDEPAQVQGGEAVRRNIRRRRGRNRARRPPSRTSAPRTASPTPGAAPSRPGGTSRRSASAETGGETPPRRGAGRGPAWPRPPAGAASRRAALSSGRSGSRLVRGPFPAGAKRAATRSASGRWHR